MSVFKAYDVRGKYPEEVNEKLAYEIGRAMILLLKAKEFLICQDARQGSKELSDALIKGITDQGANATYCGLTTTPMFYYLKYKKGFDAGVMITASHLPSGFNGLKAMKSGRTFMGYDSGYKEIEELINSGELKRTPLAKKKGTTRKENYEDEYINFITSKIIGDVSGLKIVVDASNGMAGPIAKKVLEKARVDFVGLNINYNLEKPAHGLNPLEHDAQEQIKKKIKDENASLGAIFDADADRVLFVDEKGEFLPGDYTLAILVENLAKPRDKIVHDLLCGRALREVIKKKKCIPIMTRVGHVFLKKSMVDNDARFGAEASGHMYFQEAGGAESTILCMLHMITILKKQNKPLSELVKPLKESWIKSEELNYEFESNELKDKKIEEVTKAFSNAKQSKMDGVTVEYDDKWFNVRKSNTESVIRLRIEAKTPIILRDIMKKIEGILKK
ncbi:MAG: phosphomannomutase/phosphoglucomutase [Nanoarchaeota archaeon]|nr:phosphomannomutase/phosphoglucomutase [Nanoarchaeota archaeon]MBU1269975.1 phosphomannomutase/phosphoglucomutase [Nanoarchaeota archaeon]MBU1604096.1 phosphomannomutase/phosphoglucomutase [Nanoarchaeota archaeon]MBU2443103.1 phosphomannomutase/phosphoglucomutase [Nanoarchaeota archaeon]